MQCARTSVFTCAHTVESTSNLQLTPAALSREARQGSAEMSGCYSNSPTVMSTERYHMVKKRREKGGGGGGRGMSVQEWTEDEMWREGERQ